MLKIDEKLFFIKTLKLNKRMFRKHFGIRKNSYMDTVITRLFEYHYMNALSLKKEYKKYYKNEYKTYGEFLSKRHNLFPSEFDNHLHKNMYYKDLSIASDLNIAELMNDEVIRETMLAFEETCV